MERLNMAKEIKQTTNYDQFKLCDWNRGVSENNLKKIAKSVEKVGWLKHPIMVNEDFEVIDGQHRLEYAKRNGLPIYYIVVQGADVQDCVTMNNVRATWTVADYINLFSSQGNDNYIILKNLLETYPFVSATILVAIIKNSSQGGANTSAIKSGGFEITAKEHDKAIEKLEMLKRCAKALLSVPGRASALFTATAFAYDCPGVNKVRLEKQIQTNVGIITPPANLDMAVKEIEYLYNYRGRQDNYVYIYTEYKKQAKERMLRGTKGWQAKSAERRKNK